MPSNVTYTLKWDETGTRNLEAGVSHVVLFVMENGVYGDGVAWNGVTAFNENPSGADVTDLYADNIKYASLRAAESMASPSKLISIRKSGVNATAVLKPLPASILDSRIGKPLVWLFAPKSVTTLILAWTRATNCTSFTTAPLLRLAVVTPRSTRTPMRFPSAGKATPLPWRLTATRPLPAS